MAAENGRTAMIHALIAARADIEQRDWCVTFVAESRVAVLFALAVLLVRGLTLDL